MKYWWNYISFGFCLGLCTASLILGKWTAAVIQAACAAINTPFMILWRKKEGKERMRRRTSRKQNIKMIMGWCVVVAFVALFVIALAQDIVDEVGAVGYLIVLAYVVVAAGIVTLLAFSIKWIVDWFMERDDKL